MNTLKKETFVQVAGVVFLAAGLLHGFRAFNEWDLVYNDWIVPLWLSWVVAVGALYLAYCAFTHNKKK